MPSQKERIRLSLGSIVHTRSWSRCLSCLAICLLCCWKSTETRILGSTRFGAIRRADSVLWRVSDPARREAEGGGAVPSLLRRTSERRGRPKLELFSSVVVAGAPNFDDAGRGFSELSSAPPLGLVAMRLCTGSTAPISSISVSSMTGRSATVLSSAIAQLASAQGCRRVLGARSSR